MDIVKKDIGGNAEAEELELRSVYIYDNDKDDQRAGGGT